MKKLSQLILTACLVLVVSSPAMSQVNVNKPILCSLNDVNECAMNDDCFKVTPESVALPNFIEINLAKKQISSAGTATAATSPIKQVERLNGKLILQGGDASGDNPRGGVGWTLSMDEASGKLSIAGVGDAFALVVFGHCISR